MAATEGELKHRTRANHYKGRRGIAMGGHLHLRFGADPALIFHAHPFFQRRYELQMRLLDIRSVTGGTGRARMVVELSQGTSESFLMAGGMELLPALEKARRAAQRGVTIDRPVDGGPHYWATGTYDPERYYRETRGWSTEYREHVRDAYGDLDSFNANHPD